MPLSKRLFFYIAISVCCFYASLAMAAPLTATEQQINDAVLKQSSAQLALLKQLVNINSGSTNIAGVRQVGNIIRKQLMQLGFKTQWIAESASMHRAPTLVAWHIGKKGHGKRLLLIGHLDTVFPADSPFQHFELKKFNAKGPGALDDKGGDVVIIYALKALQAGHVLKEATITVVLTGDEEDSGKPTSISRKPLFDAAHQSDIALDFESAITLNTATIARRGISGWTVTTFGNQSHSATIFQPGVGAGAIFELATILDTMRVQLKDIKYLSFNPGIIVGGTALTYDDKTSYGTAFGKTNVVARTGLVAGDLRFVDDAQEKFVQGLMSSIVKQSLPYTKATITFQPGIPAMQATAANLKLLDQYSAVSEDLNLGVIKPLDPGLRGAGDISHIADLMLANLAGLGPLGIGAHTVIESVALSSLPIQTRRAAVLMYRLTLV